MYLAGDPTEKQRNGKTMAKVYRSREAVARSQVGYTRFSPGVPWFLIAVLILGILVIPVLTFIRSGGTSLNCFRELPPSAEDFATAERDYTGLWQRILSVNDAELRRIKRVEDDLGNTSVLKKSIVPWIRWTLAAYLQAGNEDAYVRRGGRLLYRPDVDFATAPGFLLPKTLRNRVGVAANPIPAIIDFKKQLADRGIELVVFPIPLKTTEYPGDPNNPLVNPSMDDFLGRMKDAGVLCYNPADMLVTTYRETANSSYLLEDTHWTPQAMADTAENLSEFLRSHVKLSAPAKPEIWTKSAMTVENHGDIAGMLTLPPGKELSPKEKVTIHPISSPDGAPWRSDPNAEVLFLGDSFANIYSDPQLGWGSNAGFAEQLSYNLGIPLDCIVKNAGGSAATRLELGREMRSGRHDRLMGKKVVVWSFAARDLASGDWPVIDVTFNDEGKADEVAGSRTIKVRITGISTFPDVNAPYGDSLSVASGELIDGGSGTVLLQGWSMRGRKLEPMAAWSTGQTLKLRVEPWYDRLEKEPELETIQVINDIDDMESPLFWVEGTEK